MKKILLILLAMILIVMTACSKGGKVNLTYEQAKYISGFISLDNGQYVGLCDDGTIKSFGALLEKQYIAEMIEQNSGSEITKISYCDHEDECVVLLKDGKLLIGDYSFFHHYDDIIYENCKDFIWDEFGLTVLYNDGTIYSDRYYFDNNPSSVVYIGDDSGLLCCTLADGTVTLADGILVPGGWESVSQRTKNITLETASWTNIEMAQTFYDNTGEQAVGLKKDGTVVATGRFADMVKDWKNIVYLDTGYTQDSGCIIALTSNGKLLAAGDNLDKLNLTDMVSGKTTNPFDSKDIIAFDIDRSALITLDVYGRLFIGGADIGDGIGPKEFIIE